MDSKNFKKSLKIKDDNIKVIEYGQEINIPEDYTLTYITRNGKIIMCKEVEKQSTHMYVAEKYFKIKKDKNIQDFDSIFKVLARGNIMLADISSGDEKSIFAGFREDSKTNFQKYVLEKIKNKGYAILEDQYSEQSLKIRAGELPKLNDIDIENNNEIGANLPELA